METTQIRGSFPSSVFSMAPSSATKIAHADYMGTDARQDQEYLRGSREVDINLGSPKTRTVVSIWDLPSLVKDLPNKEEYLSKTITLTRKQDTVDCSTPERYLREVYGNLGSDFLKNIITALQNNTGVYGK